MIDDFKITIAIDAQTSDSWRIKKDLKFGRGVILYSSATQDNLEKRYGVELYKVDDEAYVNRATKVYIDSNPEHFPFLNKTHDSEPDPSIEFEDTIVFTEHPIEIPNLMCATWHPFQRTLFAVAKGESNSIICHIFDIHELKVKRQTTLDIPTSDNLVTFTDMSHHPELQLIQLTAPDCLMVINYETSTIISMLKYKNGELWRGGFYPDDQHVWTISRGLGVNLWGIWNYQTNTYSEFEWEHIGNYARGAVLHPSGQLIGALWNDHQCGYYLHLAEPQNGNLHYFEEPVPDARDEYENYSPCFSPDG